jgi:hypothetical protein
MEETVLLKDLPRSLVESVVHDIANYTIGFLKVLETPTGVDADLLGSGVLVSVGSKRAILTADHVVDVLPKSGRIGLVLGRTTQPYTIDTGGIVCVRIGRGHSESSGPDLAAIVLAPQIAGAIAAKKLFFNLQTHAERVLNGPLELRDGAWFAQGFLQERTTVLPDPAEEGLTKYFYNFTGVGGPDTVQTADDYDYFDYPVSPVDRIEAPVKWGGMSGGGVWQVPIKNEGLLTHGPVSLAGLMFYQYPTTETQCGIKAHGPRSVYGKALQAIREP